MNVDHLILSSYTLDINLYSFTTTIYLILRRMQSEWGIPHKCITQCYCFLSDLVILRAYIGDNLRRRSLEETLEEPWTYIFYWHLMAESEMKQRIRSWRFSNNTPIYPLGHPSRKGVIFKRTFLSSIALLKGFRMVGSTGEKEIC